MRRARSAFPTFTRVLALCVALALGPLGCSPAGTAVGAASVAGKAAMQERGFGAAVSDTTLEARIGGNLLNHSAGLFVDVSVEALNGDVLLTGAVEVPEHRVEAARIAWATDGTRDVINDIMVRDESGLVDAARDSWITTKLSTLVTVDKDIRGINYSIETVNGIVFLLGIAQSQAELDKVIAHARQIGHVRRIVSHVRLKENLG